MLRVWFVFEDQEYVVKVHMNCMQRTTLNYFFRIQALRALSGFLLFKQEASECCKWNQFFFVV